MMVGNLFVAYQALDIRFAALLVVFLSERKCRRGEPYHFRRGLLHVVGYVAAVGAGVGEQLCFVKLLRAVEGLLRGVAEELVRVALEGGEVVELWRISVFLLLYNACYAGGFAAVLCGAVGVEFALYLAAFGGEFSAVQHHGEIFCGVELFYLFLALYKHGEGRGLHSSHGKHIVVLAGEEPRRVHADYPVCLAAGKSRAVQRVVFAAVAEVSEAVANGFVGHAAYPQALYGLGAFRFVIDIAENTFALAACVRRADELVHVWAFHKRFKTLELLRGAFENSPFEVVGDDGEILEPPRLAAVGFAVFLGTRKSHKVPEAPRYYISVTLGEALRTAVCADYFCDGVSH